MPVEELHSHLESNPEPLDSTQHELILSQQPPIIAKAKPYRSSDMDIYSTASVIGEIGQLLDKVETLSRNVPTTVDRLSQISGLFPPGHGPSEEAVKEETEHETKLLDSFRSAIYHIQTGLIEFRSKQDSICKEYEREAFSIEKQISEEDAVHGCRHDEAPYFHDSGLGQSATYAEVILNRNIFYMNLFMLYTCELPFHSLLLLLFCRKKQNKLSRIVRKLTNKRTNAPGMRVKML